MNTSTVPHTSLVDFKEVKSRVTILQILERYDLLRTLKRAADRLSGPCPLHQGTNPTQFRVSISRNCFNCFGACGRGGNVIDFVSLREGVPFREAALLLQEWFMPDKAASPLAEETPKHLDVPKPQNGPLLITAPTEGAQDDDGAGENLPLSFELKALKPDHPYLAERGLTQATIASYGIGYCTRGCLRGHIVIPIRNRDGALTGYIGRWPGNPPEGQGKYKLPKGFRKSREVFNIDRVVASESSHPLIVVEGVFDCLRLVQFGFPDTVAILGSKLSARQEILLREVAGAKRSLYLLFDADEAGREGSLEAASKLCRSCTVRNVEIGEYGHQPDQLEPQDIKVLLGEIV